MTQELKPGEFVVHANGTVEGVLKFTKTSFKHSKEFLRESTWEVHEYVSHLIDNLGYTRVSTEGSAIKEVAPANQFRIGGYYRDHAGDLCQVMKPGEQEGFAIVRFSADGGNRWHEYDSEFRLSDGCHEFFIGRSSEMHLIPGELDESGNPIGTVAYAETTQAEYDDLQERVLRSLNDLMVSRDQRSPTDRERRVMAAIRTRQEQIAAASFCNDLDALKGTRANPHTANANLLRG